LSLDELPTCTEVDPESVVDEPLVVEDVESEVESDVELVESPERAVAVALWARTPKPSTPKAARPATPDRTTRVVRRSRSRRAPSGGVGSLLGWFVMRITLTTKAEDSSGMACVPPVRCEKMREDG
jgi:hypothetical protein